MASTTIRERRRTLRYRNLLVPGSPDGTDENQDQFAADGSLRELQQAAAAQGRPGRVSAHTSPSRL